MRAEHFVNLDFFDAEIFLIFENNAVKIYQLNDFHDNSAWLIFRLDVFVQNKPLDIYNVLSLPAGELIAYELVETYLSQTQADSLLTIAKTKTSHLPHRIILPVKVISYRFLKGLFSLNAFYIEAFLK